MNDYEEKKQARIDRYRERAEKARARSSQLSHESVSMLEHIPPGQPILADHHSARGHRKLLERSDRKMEQSIAASEKADYYEHKARAAENNTAISSDDPAALEKLQAKLSKLQENQAFMKKVNAYYRKHQTCRGCEGVSSELAAKLDNGMADAYSWETAPYPAFALSNNNQEIHRIQERIKQLERNRDIGFQGWEFEGGHVEANTDLNRLQIFFDDIPPAETRQELKGRGFRWARSEGAWQRQLTRDAIYAAYSCDLPQGRHRPPETSAQGQEQRRTGTLKEEPTMSIINASTTKMEEIEIVGIPALYTPYKVSRQTVHLGMYCYELQAGPEDWGQPRRLMDEAGEGFFGTVLTPVPVEGADGEGLAIGPEDFKAELGIGYYTPAEFEDKYLSPGYDPLRLEQIYGKED